MTKITHNLEDRTNKTFGLYHSQRTTDPEHNSDGVTKVTNVALTEQFVADTKTSVSVLVDHE